MPRDPRILRPAGNSATPFFFNAIQSDSDILMQDQHLPNDIKNGEEYKPHHPSVALHILLFTKINVLKHVIPCAEKPSKKKSWWSNWTPEQPVLHSLRVERHQGLFPSWKRLEWGSGLVYLCSCTSPFPVLLHLFLTTDNGDIFNEHPAGPGGTTAI